VAQALDGDAWLGDIQGGLSLIGFMEFLRLGDCLREVTLSNDEDQHIWRLDASGSYSAKSANRAFFTGSVTFEPWWQIWKCWAPGKCKLFIWLRCSKSMLDSRSPCSSRNNTPGEVPFMRSRRRNDSAPPHQMRIL
jgi:hypothetical protein